jgi:hypothetical protein
MKHILYFVSLSLVIGCVFIVSALAQEDQPFAQMPPNIPDDATPEMLKNMPGMPKTVPKDEDINQKVGEMVKEFDPDGANELGNAIRDKRWDEDAKKADKLSERGSDDTLARELEQKADKAGFDMDEEDARISQQHRAKSADDMIRDYLSSNDEEGGRIGSSSKLVFIGAILAFGLFFVFMNQSK